MKMLVRGQPLFNANGDVDSSSAGFKYIIDTLSHIRARIIEQKFFEVAPADFLPVETGEAAWSDEIVQNGEYLSGGGFFEGDIDLGGSRIATVDATIVPDRMPVGTWRKKTGWTIAETAKAANAGNWDPIEGKLKALKKNWDLGIQELAFLGRPGDAIMTGLVTSAKVAINTTLITEDISGMSDAEFQTFVGGLLNAYYVNGNRTAMPDTFAIPASDYLGLGAAASATYPNISKLEYLSNMLKKMTRNDGFEILPNAYCEADINAPAGVNKNRYILYRRDPDTLSMVIPVDLTMLDPRSVNGFDWEQLAYGQYSGVMIHRPREVLYLDETAGT